MPDAPLIAEATRWRIALPAGVLNGITEADAYRLGREHGVRPDRSWVRLYADGTEELGPWSPAPMLPRLRTQAERDTDGTTWRARCGNTMWGLLGGLPHVCVLAAGHGGWHRDDNGTEWTPIGPHGETEIQPRRRWWHRIIRRDR